MIMPLKELLPHGPKMIFISELKHLGTDKTIGIVRIHSNSHFFREGGVPVWVGTEYMAQTIGAYAGNYFIEKGETPKVGFLVGIRRYKTLVSSFKEGSELTVQVNPLLVDSGVGSFDCTITIDDKEVVSARITTFCPSDEQLQDLRSNDEN